MTAPISSGASEGLQGGFSDASSELRAPTYEVEQGDTITSIANQTGVDTADLLAANPDIANPDVIYVGDTLVLPTARQYTVPSRDNPSSTTPRFDSSSESDLTAPQLS